MMIIDADGLVLGRLATTVAAALQDGEELHIVNAEQAIVSGDAEDVYQRYRDRRNRGSRDHGPFFPKAPERIMKQTLKGMLPDTAAGRQAFKRLRTYRGNPDGLEAADVEVKQAADLKGNQYVTLDDISNHI